MTDRPVDFMPTADALLRGAPLEYQVEIPVLGIVTRFETNSRFVRDLAVRAFDAWRRLAANDVSAEPAVVVRVVVHDGVESAKTIRHISTPDGRLIVHTPGSVAVVDPLRRESVAYVTTRLVADDANFRVGILEAITFALLAAFDRHPVHASALMGPQRTVLLAGASGAGKSTLAWLAHSNGIDVLSDDLVWVQREGTPRVWGSSASARLGAGSLSHFPGAGASVFGDDKLALPLGGQARRPLHAPNPIVCVLARGDSAALERLGSGAIVHELGRQLADGFDRFPGRQEEVAGVLAGDGGWRLTLSGNPHDALPFLRQMLAGI